MPTPATVQLSETNGASGSPTTTDGISNINFGSIDTPNLTPIDHPIVLSAFGPTQSFTKWLRLHVSSMGTSVSISNIKIWKSSGAYLTAELIGSNCSQSVASSTAWTIAAYAGKTNNAGGGSVTTPYSGDGTLIMAGHAYRDAGFSIPTAQPANTNLTIGNVVGGSLTAPGYSDYCVMARSGDGSSGTPASNVTPANTLVITWQWDES